MRLRPGPGRAARAARARQTRLQREGQYRSALRQLEVWRGRVWGLGGSDLPLLVPHPGGCGGHRPAPAHRSKKGTGSRLLWTNSSAPLLASRSSPWPFRCSLPVPPVATTASCWVWLSTPDLAFLFSDLTQPCHDENRGAQSSGRAYGW